MIRAGQLIVVGRNNIIAIIHDHIFIFILLVGVLAIVFALNYSVVDELGLVGV